MHLKSLSYVNTMIHADFHQKPIFRNFWRKIVNNTTQNYAQEAL